MSATDAIRRAPACGYHSKLSRAVSRASSAVGAHIAIVKVDAWSCTYLPIGSVQPAIALR